MKSTHFLHIVDVKRILKSTEKKIFKNYNRHAIEMHRGTRTIHTQYNINWFIEEW